MASYSTFGKKKKTKTQQPTRIGSRKVLTKTAQGEKSSPHLVAFDILMSNRESGHAVWAMQRQWLSWLK